LICSVFKLKVFSEGVETPGNIVWDLLPRPEGRGNSPAGYGQIPEGRGQSPEGHGPDLLGQGIEKTPDSQRALAIFQQAVNLINLDEDQPPS
jgi:hypothetical protein